MMEIEKHDHTQWTDQMVTWFLADLIEKAEELDDTWTLCEIRYCEKNNLYWVHVSDWETISFCYLVKAEFTGSQYSIVEAKMDIMSDKPPIIIGKDYDDGFEFILHKMSA